MDAPETLSVEVPEAGGGGDEAITEPREFSGASRRARTSLAVLYWFEGAWAASFFGWVIAYWATLPAAYLPVLYGSEESAYRLVRTTDVPRLALYLAFIAVEAIVLAVAGFLTWRSRSNPNRTFGLIVGRGVLWSQPLLIVLMVISALAVQYGSNLNAFLPPSFATAGFVAVVVFGGLLAFLLGGAFPATGRLLSVAFTMLIIAVVLVPLLLVDGYSGSERVFSSFGQLPTGRTTLVVAVDCPSPNHCVAAGSKLVSFNTPVRYLTVVAFTGSNGRWEAASYPPALSLSLQMQFLESGLNTSIACRTNNRCLGIGFWSPTSRSSLPLPIWRSDDGGESWSVTSIRVPGGTALAEHSLACMNASDCVASNGQTVIVTRNGGERWQVVASLTATSQPPRFPAAGVACPTSRECIVALGAEEAANTRGMLGRLAMVAWTNDGGLTWTSRRVASLRVLPGAFACWSSTDCLLSGEAVDPINDGPNLLVTTDRGLQWERLPVPEGHKGWGLLQMRCVASKDCLATTGRTVIKTTNGGKTWTTLLKVSPTSWVAALSCSTAESCVAGGKAPWPSGESAALWTTHDGGRTWTSQPFPPMPVPRDLRPCPVFAKRCGFGT